uniref:Protein MIX23 n=1 Tax=Steinernema glaseri TaxID=37863 RepID=A0A1I7ZS21_9BILA
MTKTAEHNHINEVDCKDLSAFETLLRKLREFDDKIIYQLNCAIPTKSFTVEAEKKCQDIQSQLLRLRDQRMSLINRCIAENQRSVDEAMASGGDYLGTRSRLRLIRNETMIEEIVNEQTDKTVKERCTKELIKH